MVYVDRLQNTKAYKGLHPKNWRYKSFCHLFADDIEELHNFAEMIGLKRSWFQDHLSLPHYDITANKRYQAINLGAVNDNEDVNVRRFIRASMERRGLL